MPDKQQKYRIVLAGNPNCGKTTLFNLLTGSAAYVGNRAGVTVGKTEGLYECDSVKTVITDLPGIYSLSPYSPEEVVSREYITEKHPDLIINIVDASHLGRNLYLTTQLSELKIPMIVALNMYDVLEKKQMKINLDRLSGLLGCPVFPVSAHKNTGVDEMMHAAVKRLISNKKNRDAVQNIYPRKIRETLEDIESFLVSNNIKKQIISTRFAAVKIYENDERAIDRFYIPFDVRKKCKKLIENRFADSDRSMIIADSRYNFISDVVNKVLTENKSKKKSVTEKIDDVVLNRVAAIPLFAVLMLIVFNLTFGKSLLFLPVESPGVWLHGIFEQVVLSVKTFSAHWFFSLGASDFTVRLCCEGIIGGVGSVLSFLPQILLLITFLSLLEESGYMARVAFILDTPARRAGLSGRSFVPLLMGFGCSVPAMTACRTIENRRERIMTICLVPFMSCGAKMPIYLMVAGAVFPQNTGLAAGCVYLLGIVVAASAGLLTGSFLPHSKKAAFIMELPDYHRPGLHSLFIHISSRVGDFIRRAGTVVALASVIIWLLANVSPRFRPVCGSSEMSILAAVGAKIAVFFRPLGFSGGTDGWKAVAAILSGTVAKEQVVASCRLLGYLPLNIPAACSFMAFNLLNIPCIAATGTMFTEIRSPKRSLFIMLSWFFTAYAVSFIVYNAAKIIC